MSTFMVTHTMPGLTLERIRELQTAAGRHPQVRWVRHFANLSQGTVVSEFEAPSVEALQDYLHGVGMPFDYIMEAEVTGVGRDLLDLSGETDFTI